MKGGGEGGGEGEGEGDLPVSWWWRIGCAGCRHVAGDRHPLAVWGWGGGVGRVGGGGRGGGGARGRRVAGDKHPLVAGRAIDI